VTPPESRPRTRWEIIGRWNWVLIGVVGIAAAWGTGKWWLLLLDAAVIARSLFVLATPERRLEPDAGKSGLQRLRERR
jgi:uncharacterized protein (DUF58 family)